jgi:serine/threonine protein kinase
MELAIDRRQNRELFWFLMQDREFFDDLSLSASGWRDFRGVVEGFIPSDWMLLGTDIWLNVFPPKVKLPFQGFKIHISATSATATEVLRRVVPIFVASNAGFKIMADPRILEIATCKNYWRGGSGKFVTVYPRDNAHFASLIQALDKSTNDLAGPYILSDKRYADNKVLFYRYGGFAPRSVLNLFGEKVMVMEASDGRLVPDHRTPFFQLPEGIEDPFPSEEHKHEGEVCLNNRYRVKEVLTQSNSGGVYIAEDQQTSQTVVIKEARPFVNVTRENNQDAVATLREEARILQKLQHTGYVPKVVDLFQEWEHLFLVQEYLEGLPLSSYRALNDVALVLQDDASAERVERFCAQLYQITEKMIRALQAFHREGIVIGDLSPHNILVNPETLDLKIIDFEAARLAGESGSSGWTVFTPGFASSSRLSGTDLSPQDDFYSLGSVIYSLILPVQELFGLKPEAADIFIDEITRDFGLPRSVKEMIFALLKADVDRALTLIDLAKRDGIELSPVMERKIVKPSEISGIVDEIANYILSKADLTREDRLWPLSVGEHNRLRYCWDQRFRAASGNRE